ncbi:MAG: type II toxin-antitoxin system death-on-curing family toxin [Pseudonocardia sp.]|nr:type II toxin-antitoxin system death-on-curing family toxin [Pseudonocardia sp.]
MTRYLELDHLLKIADAAVSGGVIVRDVGLLQSALGRPAASAFGKDAYPTLHEKAAALLHSLTNNHALRDGNKRLAWAATAVFLGINGQRVVAAQDDVVDRVVAVADGSLSDVAAIAKHLAPWSPPHERG